MTAVASESGPSAAGGLLDRRAPLIAALIALVAGFATLSSDPIGVFNDDGLYLLTARALAEGQGFVYPQLPGTPSAIHYPPLWPMVLAVFWKFAPAFPDSASLLKLINPCLIACAAAGMVVTGRRLLGLPSWAALTAAVVATASIPVLLLTMFLLSEPLFLALLFPALLASERLVREGGDREAAIAALLGALLVLTRTLGGVLPVATMMLLVHSRRWRAAGIYATVGIALVLPWQLFVWSAAATFPDELRGSYGPYLEWVMDGYREGRWPVLSATILENLRDLRDFAANMAFPYTGGAFRGAIGLVCLAAMVGGAVLLWSSGRARVTLLALAGYVGVAVAWPFLIDRFLWAVWPLLVLVIVGALHEALKRVAHRGRAPRLALITIAAIVLVGHETYTVRGFVEGFHKEMSREMTAYGVNLARAVNLEPRLKGRRIVSELAPLVALYGGDTVIPAEILTARQHLERKSIAKHRFELEAIDDRFRPHAFVVLRDGPYLAALREAQLTAGRSLTDISAPDAFVRIFLVSEP